MAAQIIENQLPTFTGLDGLPLQDGYVYFGEPNQNPTEYPIPVYYDEALTIVAPNPMRTNQGYLWRNGTPARAWVDGPYSILVLDSKRRQIYYLPEWEYASARNVSFIQPYTGAELMSVQQKLEQTFNARDFEGVVGDGSNDDTAGLIRAINAANGRWVELDPGIYRITAPLDTLTSKEIRFFCQGNAFHAGLLTPALGDGRAWIKCDGVGLVGSYVKATSTMTLTNQLQGLSGISMYAVNSAPFAALTQGFDLILSGCHFQQFVRHGIWTAGASTSFGDKSSFWDIGTTVNCYNVGAADGSGGTPTSQLFMDGCALRIDCDVTSGLAGNEVSQARAITSVNRPTTVNINGVLIGFSGNPTTSFKGINALGLTGGCTWNGIVSYGGIWTGWSNVTINSPWLETYAVNGYTTTDATPFSMVDWNSTLRVSEQYLRQAQSRLRSTGFSAGTDFHGYESSSLANKQVNRINPAELVFGQWLPDAGSTPIQPVVALGTTANPLAYFDTTLNALLVSKGSHFYPLLAFPTFQSGNVADGANVTTTTPAYSQWDIGGGTISTTGGTEYEVSILAINAASGRAYHHSTWRQIFTQFGGEVYELGSIDPVAGVTVTASSGNLNIANASGITLAWVASFRLIGPCVAAPVN